MVHDPVNVLRRVLVALGPYRDDVVLIGGWVPFLYQQYGPFPNWTAPIARTTELDLVVPSPFMARNRRPLAEVLRSQGFSATSDTNGAHWSKGPDTEETIEFFVPHQGTNRTLGHPRNVPGQKDIGAVPLTNLSMLTDNTVRLEIGFLGPVQVAVRVPPLTLGASYEFPMNCLTKPLLNWQSTTKLGR